MTPEIFILMIGTNNGSNHYPFQTKNITTLTSLNEPYTYYEKIIPSRV